MLAERVRDVPQQKPRSSTVLPHHSVKGGAGIHQPGDRPATRSTPLGTALAFGRKIHFFRLPGSALALLDKRPDEPSHDLRGRRVVLSAESLEDGLLARVDEDRQASGADFEGQGRVTRFTLK